MICITLGVRRCWCFCIYFLFCNFGEVYWLLDDVVVFAFAAIWVFSCCLPARDRTLGYYITWDILPEFVLSCYIGYFGWIRCCMVSVVSIFLLFWWDYVVVPIILGIFIIALVIFTDAGFFLWSWVILLGSALVLC